MRCSCRRIAGRARTGATGFSRRSTPSSWPASTRTKVAGKPSTCRASPTRICPRSGRLRLTRGILEALLPHQPRLLIQTRGPLVVRDRDLLQRFQAVRVNVSVPTDDETVRQAFEPKAPPLEQRWQALATLRAAGIPVAICVTPLLPLGDVPAFAARLLAFGPRCWSCRISTTAAAALAPTRDRAARQLLAERGWSPEAYQQLLELLRRRTVFEGESGFFPPGRFPLQPQAASGIS